MNGYDVTCKRVHWQCNCLDHQHRRDPCKHMYATGKVKPPFRFTGGPATHLCRVSLHCPKCRFLDMVRNGNRTLRDGTKKQTYLCRCGYRFTWRPGFEKRWFDDETITSALLLYAHGPSFRTISEYLSLIHI